MRTQDCLNCVHDIVEICVSCTLLFISCGFVNTYIRSGCTIVCHCMYDSRRLKALVFSLLFFFFQGPQPPRHWAYRSDAWAQLKRTQCIEASLKRTIQMSNTFMTHWKNCWNRSLVLFIRVQGASAVQMAVPRGSWLRVVLVTHIAQGERRDLQRIQSPATA